MRTIPQLREEVAFWRNWLMNHEPALGTWYGHQQIEKLETLIAKREAQYKTYLKTHPDVRIPGMENISS